MKKIVTTLLITILTLSGLYAQDLKDVVRDYQRNNSEFTMVIPSFLIKMGLAFGEMEDEEREAMEMIDNMKIVISENRFGKNDFTALEEGIRKGYFVELMTVYEQDDKVRMIMNQKSKRKSEMLMIVESKDENVLMLIDFHGEPDFGKFITLAD